MITTIQLSPDEVKGLDRLKRAIGVRSREDVFRNAGKIAELIKGAKAVSEDYQSLIEELELSGIKDLPRRIAAAKKGIAAGKGKNWRDLRDDVY